MEDLTMNKLYSYDNCEGDKGVIVAESYEEAVEIYKKEYPKRKIVENGSEYWDNGCYLKEEGSIETKLYCTFPL